MQPSPLPKRSTLTSIPLLERLRLVAAKNTLYSRVHKLRSFDTPLAHCFVKREDELGFGVSGTKVRKYLSFLPHFLKAKLDEAIITGSAYSNHVLSLSLLLRENGVEPILFLLGDPSCKLQGNLLFSSLIAKKENIHWISRKCWGEIDDIAAQFALARANAQVVPKGANCASAIPGALTLALDILRNEEELGIAFDHILIDSGTGMSAAALLLAFAYLQKKTAIHIVQVAGDEKEFTNTLSCRKNDLEYLLDQSLDSPTNFRCYLPSNAQKFGSANTLVLNTIAELARSEGFLTDPVFTAKLFYEGKKIIAQEDLKGNILFIHSGGALSLMGFQEQMAKFAMTYTSTRV